MKPTSRGIAAITESFDDTARVQPCQCLEVAEPLDYQHSLHVCQGRLHRAAFDQIFSDEAMFSRYRIWAETLRGALMAVIEDLDGGRPDENTRRNVVLVANSLAAFCEIQSRFGPDLGETAR
jgi:hypothetical protein